VPQRDEVCIHSHLLVILDHTGILGPGEIYLSLSEPLINPETGEKTLNPTGDCLVYRNPVKLPSDIQKVRAVECPALRQLQNVIVFNTKDPKRSLASKLAGGGELCTRYRFFQSDTCFQNP
jgi:hypothetical protein